MEYPADNKIKIITCIVTLHLNWFGLCLTSRRDDTKVPRAVKQPSPNHRRLVVSVGRASVYCAGGQGFEPQTGPTLRVLK